jgi:hypothetical protein
MSVAAVMLGVACLLAAWLLWRLFRRSDAQLTHQSAAGQGSRDATPRGQFLALADSVREALIHRFGTTCRAKTTEELKEDSQLEQALGREPLDDLIRFLDRVDLLKFAPERSNRADGSLHQELTAWKPKVGDLLLRIQTPADGRAKTKNPVSQAPRQSRAGIRDSFKA